MTEGGADAEEPGGADAEEADDTHALVEADDPHALVHALVEPDDTHERQSPAVAVALQQGGIGAEAVKKPSGSTDVSCHHTARESQSREPGIDQRERKRERRERARE